MRVEKAGCWVWQDLITHFIFVSLTLKRRKIWRQIEQNFRKRCASGAGNLNNISLQVGHFLFHYHNSLNVFFVCPLSHSSSMIQAMTTKFSSEYVFWMLYSWLDISLPWSSSRCVRIPLTFSYCLYWSSHLIGPLDGIQCLHRADWHKMGIKWPFSCFVGCYFLDLFKTACSILILFPSSFFSKHFNYIVVLR